MTQPNIELVGSSAFMREVREELGYAARSDAKVLITGESGVGKESIARIIHQRGSRSLAPFVAINCSGLPESLFESELLGARGGLQQALTGTLFLHNVGEISASKQAALLRFLESGRDVRIISGADRNLFDEVRGGRFGEQLYYRLNILQATIPPLRVRKEDVPLMVNEIVQAICRANQLPQPRILEETLNALVSYSWPGNVRELENVVERLVICAGSGPVHAADLPIKIRQTLAVTDRRMLERAG